ncbi:MAG: COG4223 family protein [Alkalilacustris sp.]
MPLVLGGVIAAALGAGALWWLEGEGIVTLSETDIAPLEARLAAQTDRIAALEADLAPMREALAGLDGGLTELVNRLAQQEAGRTSDLAALAERVAAVDARLSGIENLPMGVDAEAMAILRGYRDEVAGLRSELLATTERAEALIAASEAAEARALAAEGTLEGLAAAAASAEAAARARNSLRQIEGAFLFGGSFAGPLDDLAGVGIEVPATLRGLAGDGVPTLAELREAFPDPAREALQIALRDVEDKPLAERMTAFLQLQFGMRSLTPRDGDDADAVLSRAEAALGLGEVGRALAELATLPAAVRAPFQDWAAQAETRQAAEAALADLAAQVESL